MPVLSADQRTRICFTLNGRPATVEAEPRTLLLDALRHGVGATGTHAGCEHGVCGACTVLLDNEPVRACLMLAVQAEGRALRTVEGLADGDALSDLQAAFRRHHALQCGFCTPGILMSLEAALVAGADEAGLRDALGGHLCRCTGYTPILCAALEVAAARRSTTDA